MDKKKLKAFLIELTALTDKYNIEIGGCGCCGSPWLYDNEVNEYLGECLEFDNDVKGYTVNDDTSIYD